MLTQTISFVNFNKKIRNSLVKKELTKVLDENNQIIKSIGKNYKYSFKKKKLNKYKRNLDFRIIGMGGSSLGAKAIYNFLKHRIKKFEFIV